MLNKELLLTTESQLGGHIKLTVGEGTTGGTFGYDPDENAGSINRIPTWNKEGNPIKMWSLYTIPDNHNTAMIFYQALKVDANTSLHD